MIGNFKANLPYNNFLLLIYGLILKWALFVYPVTPVALSTDTLFFKSILTFVFLLGHSAPLFYSVIVFLLIYFQAVFLNRIVINQRLFSKTNYLTGMSYLLLTSLFSFWSAFSSVLLAATLLIWVLSILSRLSNIPDPKKTLFNVAILLGLATLIFFPSILFLLLALIGLSIMRPFRLPEWIILFFGLGTPFYFLWAYSYLFDKNTVVSYSKFAIGIPSFSLMRGELIAAIVITLLLFVGFYFVQINMRRLLVQSRNTWAIILFYLAISFLIPFIDESASFHDFFLIVAPISVLSAAGFVYPNKKWFPFVIHWTFVILSILIGVYDTIH